jgi:threonine/homoserine/homoserine lactone efflux protein
MLPLETILAFTAASLVLACAPGPDNIFVLTQSSVHGWRIGIAVTLGLCVGLMVHTAAVALGVAVIFQRSEVAFTGLKIVGAAYLLYLAYGAFRAGSVSVEANGGQTQPYSKMFLRGIVMNVTNPKVAIFSLAFFPQFTSPERGSMTFQVVMLGMLFIASALLVFSLISIAAGTISQRLLRSAKAQVALNRFAGVVFIGLAAKLAVSQR